MVLAAAVSRASAMGVLSAAKKHGTSSFSAFVLLPFYISSFSFFSLSISTLSIFAIPLFILLYLHFYISFLSVFLPSPPTNSIPSPSHLFPFPFSLLSPPCPAPSLSGDKGNRRCRLATDDTAKTKKEKKGEGAGATSNPNMADI